jgi:hypothetical protein
MLTSISPIWVTGSAPNADAYVSALDGSGAKRVSTNHTPQFPIAGNRLLIWDTYTGGLSAYDPVSGKVLTLTNQPGYAVASESWVAWDQQGQSSVQLFKAGECRGR